MSSLNSINYSNGTSYNKPQISASTKRKLESLGIDPCLVTSESHALSLIAARQSERSFEQYAVSKQNQDNVENNQTNKSTETELISEAKNLAEQLGLTLEHDMTFDEITSEISAAINDLFNKGQNNPELIQKAQQYQAQLNQITNQFDNATKSTSELYSAMAFQANNTRYLLGL